LARRALEPSIEPTPVLGQPREANLLRVIGRIGERHIAELMKHGSVLCQRSVRRGALNENLMRLQPLAFCRWRAAMSNNLAMLSRVMARVDAGVVLVACLLLAQAPNFSTECLGHDISIAENGPHEGGASPSRHASGEDANHNFAFGYLEFDRTPDPRTELRRISENGPAHEGSARAEELMSSILDWLVAHFDLPTIQEAPRIEFIHRASMAEIRYRGSVGSQAMPLDMGRDIVAVYDDAKRTIYLPEGWTGVTPAEQSLLVHEMVHHLQNLGNLKYECLEAREKLAFATQKQWLELFGLGLLSEFELDPFTLLVRTSCLG